MKISPTVVDLTTDENHIYATYNEDQAYAPYLIYLPITFSNLSRISFLTKSFDFFSRLFKNTL